MDKKQSKSSGLVYQHLLLSIDNSGPTRYTHEEKFTYNDKGGVSFSFYHKEGDKQEKIKGHRNLDGTFTLTTFDNGKKDDKTLTKEELIKEISKHKGMKFAIGPLKELKDVKGGRKRMSRKPSKKTSKKTSRKTSRRTSRK